LDTKDKIREDFYKFLKQRAENKDKEYFGRNAIHCSSLDSCVRQVVFEYFDYPKKELTLAELLMFEISNFVHSLLREWSKNSKHFSLLADEFNLSDYLPDEITGKCDLVIQEKDTGKIILTDTKTAMPTAFKSYSNWLVKDSHKIQINSYRYALEKMGINVDEMIITYFDRGGTNQPIFVDIDSYSKQDIQNIFDKYITAIQRYKEEEVLPPKIDLEIEIKDSSVYAKKSWQCSYCKYVDITCEGYPNLDRKKAKEVGKLVGSEFIPYKGYEYLEYDVNRVLKKQNKTDDEFYDFCKGVSDEK